MIDRLGQQEASSACTPRSGGWVRVIPDLKYRKEVMLVRDEGEFYLFAAHLVDEVKRVVPARRAGSAN